MGALAVRENLPEIQANLRDVNLLFLVAGLEGHRIRSKYL